VLGHDATWAPNGKLVFGKGNDLYTAEHDGANMRKIATAPGFPTNINFSPDGTRFRFAAFNPVNNVSAIWEARADGSDIHPVLPGWNNPPAECNKLMLYDVKSEKWRQLNIDVSSFGYLAWSRDSAYVYFDTVLLARGGYFRVRISDSKLEKVIDLTKFRQFPQQFGPGSWTGLGLGDIPLIPRDISTQEIYALDMQLP
jgi:hypothetical protein